MGALLKKIQMLLRMWQLWRKLPKELKVGAAQILGIAIPFARDVVKWYMETTGKTSITLAELKAKSPDELLAEVGVVLP
jgi:hypothetical protein